MTTPFQGRSLDRAESFFWFLDRLSSMNFAVIAEGHGRLLPGAVQAALDRAQTRHHLLAASIETNAENLLQFAPRPAAGIALHCLDMENWHQRLAELNVRPFGLGEYPLMRACLFASGDGNWALALVFHHSIGDARSGFHLLGEVLGDAVEPGTRLSAVAPRPPLTELYPPEFSGELALRAGERMKAGRNDSLQQLGLPEPAPGHRPSKEAPVPRLVPLRLSREQAEALVRRARRERASINGLVGAAQLVALRSLFGDREAHTLALTCAATCGPICAARSMRVPPASARRWWAACSASALRKTCGSSPGN